MDHKQISETINRLTDDEDQRQDMWVDYLSGNPLSPKISLNTYADHESIRQATWTVFQDSTRMNSILDSFSELERTIIFCLMVGLSLSEISEYKGISEVRIRQIIATIRYNGTWSEVHGGFKEKPNRC